MSYDIRLAVKVDGTDFFADIAEPELSSPTYNLRDMFVACMNWDYSMGEYYPCADVIEKADRGIAELKKHPKKYDKFNPPNRWDSRRKVEQEGRMITITYTYNELRPTNKDAMIAALTNSIDDGGAYYEGVVEYNIDCPYYSDSDCLNEHEGNKCGTAAYSAGCVRCKLSWLNRRYGTYPSNDGRWEISEGEE